MWRHGRKTKLLPTDHTFGVVTAIELVKRDMAQKRADPKVSPIAQVPVTSSALLEPVVEWGA